MLDALRGHARSLASLEPAQILHLEGTLRGSGDCVAALYAGNGSNLEFIVASLFATPPSRQKVREVSPLFLTKALAGLQIPTDLMVVERPPLWGLVGPSPEIRIPAWIRQELRLDPHAAERWTLGRHLEREVQRHIRRRGYRLVMSEAEADKNAFFAELYQPYIRSRHGAGAITVDQKKFAAVASKSTLAKLFAGDSWTAGLLLQRHADTLQFGWFGSKENPPSPGASEVLDVLCIKMSAERGVRRVSFGNSRPSLKDGIARYKSKFGARFVMPRYPQTRIELQLLSTRKALRDWLTDQQFVCEHRGGLAVAGYSCDQAGIRFTALNSTP